MILPELSLTLEDEIHIFAKEIKNYFSKQELENIAREVKFVQRKGKLEAWHFLFLCSFLEVEVAKDTLQTLCSRIGAKLDIIVSKQAINQRFTNMCTEFLKKIFRKLMKDTIKSRVSIKSNIDNHFKRIRILDSTGFQLPEKYSDIYPGSGGNASSAGVKVQLEYELKSGEFLNIDFFSGKDSDCSYSKTLGSTIQKDDLILRDLGYFDLDEFEIINKKSAYYISRVKANTKVYILNKNIEYFKNGSPKKGSIYEEIDLVEIMENMKTAETIEIKEAFVGEEKKLPTRLVIYKHTEKELVKITNSVKKESKKKGKQKSEKTMKLLGLCVYMTNISNQVLKNEEIHDIYSLRWQVELIFKTWKSIYNMEKVRNVKLDRFECQLYGKLILVLLSSTITFRIRAILLIKKKKEISEIKVTSIICEYLESLYFKIINSPNKVCNILSIIFQDVCKNGKKSHKKDKPTVFDILGVRYNNGSDLVA